jgi:hypothetical protein
VFRFKREIAREARNSRSDKSIALKRILAFEAAEEAKDREVAEVRLKHIHLQNQLEQLEADMKQKEEVSSCVRVCVFVCMCVFVFGLFFDLLFACTCNLTNISCHATNNKQLAEGLHLIDFEQLKIENQTLNEKIEECNDELHKLRKKTTTTVQVLTHMKEKLQFVQ